MSIINKACIKVNMWRVAVHEKKKQQQQQKTKNMIVLPVEVVLAWKPRLKMHLKFTIDEVTATTIYI